MKKEIIQILKFMAKKIIKPTNVKAAATPKAEKAKAVTPKKAAPVSEAVAEKEAEPETVAPEVEKPAAFISQYKRGSEEYLIDEALKTGNSSNLHKYIKQASTREVFSLIAKAKVLNAEDIAGFSVVQNVLLNS